MANAELARASCRMGAPLRDPPTQARRFPADHEYEVIH